MPSSTPTSREVFNRFALGTRSTPPVPDPQFPKLPAQIKNKFPELVTFWDQWEKDIETWVKAKQTIQENT